MQAKTRVWSLGLGVRRLCARVRSALLLGGGLALALGTGGCAVFSPKDDPTRFFVLSAPTAIQAPAPADAPSLSVRPVELANYLRGRPLIVRQDDNEIEFRDFARWGETLEQGVARVLREELIARGAAGTVAIPGTRIANRRIDFELTVRVLACEGRSDGTVNFRALWELSPFANRTAVIARGDFQAADLKWDAASESALVAQMSQAVAGLAGEVAAALGKQD